MPYRPSAKGQPAPALARAIDFLRECLAAGPITRTELAKRLRKADFSPSTLSKARKALGVTNYWHGRVHYVRLPAE